MLYSATFYGKNITQRRGVLVEKGVSSEEKAKKKWIVHVKIDKSRGDSLRGVGRNSILEG